jgi:hypothetical protein
MGMEMETGIMVVHVHGTTYISLIQIYLLNNSPHLVPRIVLLELKKGVLILLPLEPKIDIMEMGSPVSSLKTYVEILTLKCKLRNVMLVLKEDGVHVKLKRMNVLEKNQCMIW